MTKVTMYSTSWCPFCVRAKHLLAEKNAEVDEVDVDQVPEGRQQMLELSGRRTVPQIWIGDRYVGGWDELSALQRAGQLDDLLNK